jgi:DNA polymerase (family X)
LAGKGNGEGTKLTNEEIAAIFTDIADMLNKKQENLFKIKAYDKVARSIRELNEPVTKLAAENRLREIPGVGDAIELKLKELTGTGKLEFYEKLKLELSPGAESPQRSRL